MKTAKLLLILLGVFSLSFVYPYTAIDLPQDIFQNHQTIISIKYQPSSNVKMITDEKPRVIELEGVTVVDVFPPNSVQCLQQQIRFPAFSGKGKLEGFVAVRLIFNRNGDIEIKEACSNHPELKDYITEQMSNIHFNNCCMQMERDYYLKFNFKLL